MSLFKPALPQEPKNPRWDPLSAIPFGVGLAGMTLGYLGLRSTDPVGSIDNKINDTVSSWETSLPDYMHPGKDPTVPSKLSEFAYSELSEIEDRRRKDLESWTKTPKFALSPASIQDHERFKGDIFRFAEKYCPEAILGASNTETSFSDILTNTLPASLFQRGLVFREKDALFIPPKSYPTLNRGFSVTTYEFMLTDSVKVNDEDRDTPIGRLVLGLQERLEDIPTSRIYDSHITYGAVCYLWEEKHPISSEEKRSHSHQYMRDKFARIAQLTFTEDPEIALIAMAESKLSRDNFSSTVADQDLFDEVLKVSKEVLDSSGIKVSSDDEIQSELLKLFESHSEKQEMVSQWQAAIRERLWIPLAKREGGAPAPDLLPQIALGVGYALTWIGVMRRPNKLRDEGIRVRTSLDAYPYYSWVKIPHKSIHSPLVRTIPTPDSWPETTKELNRLWSGNVSERYRAENAIVAIWALEHPIRDNAIWCMSSLEIKNFYTFRFLILLPSKIEAFPEEEREKGRRALSALQIDRPFGTVDMDARLRGLVALEGIGERNSGDKEIATVVDVVQYVISKDFQRRTKLQRSSEVSPALGA